MRFLIVTFIALFVAGSVAKPILLQQTKPDSLAVLDNCLWFVGDLFTASWKSIVSLVTLNFSEWVKNLEDIALNIFMILINCVAYPN
ncbi:unnamed protein product [Moneuplotes crassus]|uniref:Uncharacterized protein n=1 Tax=Euplotes crassus TaxID=5936 RepID=A0AAD1Y2N8_EUPCR|nr:unnamed protein product [Moneuplotes crassus]